MEQRKAKYDNLCQRVSEHCSTEVTFGNITLGYTKSCKEINTWTYWQGRGNLNPKILLVGQDWGNSEDAEKVISRVMNGEPYSEGTNPTNINLEILFKSIGYDLNVQNKDLFFTNLIPYYRKNKGISGGYSEKWLSKDIQTFFKELIDILQPTVILCLGKLTFKGVLKSLQCKDFNKHTAGSYNKIIEKGYVSVDNIKIYPLAHCGNLGTNNRNKGHKYNDKLDIQLCDWSKIKI